MSVELPEPYTVNPWFDNYSGDWLDSFASDNVILGGMNSAALNHAEELKRYLDNLDRPGEYQYKGIRSAMAWLRGATSTVYDLRIRYEKRHELVWKYLMPEVKALEAERDAVRKLYEPIIEQAHEDRERAEYYRALLDEHHIEY
jgi:hypothetical protein